ncbi:MAG TPA: response regulator [Caulobacteraceae bacterium]|jgi:DNA-binding response OmpR family regulator
MQRVLIVDPQPAATKLLSELLRDVCQCQIWASPDAQQAMALAGRIEPLLVFVEHCVGLNGTALARELRRSDLACRKAPIIMISSEATAASIIGARDAGVHEFLRKPFTIKDLTRRLEAVALKPRDWVEAINYVGPDRRRFNSGDYAGQLKRRVDHAVTADQARLYQALRILKTAVSAIDSDPRQALRSLLAQADDICAVARAAGETNLRVGATALGQKLRGLDSITLRRAEIEELAAPLIAAIPVEPASARRSAA